MAGHKPDCAWLPDGEHCTCGALVLTKAYRFGNGNIIAFDQYGTQIPYYQAHGHAEARIRADYPGTEIRLGEIVP